MTQILLSYSGPEWLFPLCLIAVLLLTLYAYRKYSSGAALLRKLIYLADSLFILILLSGLFGPELQYTREVHKKPEAFLFYDLSESCRSFRTIAAFFHAAKRSLTEVLQKKGYQVRIKYFGRFLGDKHKPVDDVMAADSLFEPEWLVPGISAHPDSIAVLLSDGRFRQSRFSVAKRSGIPLFTLRSPTLAKNSALRDLRITGKPLPGRMQKLIIRYSCFAPGMLRVFVDGEKLSSTPVAAGAGRYVGFFKVRKSGSRLIECYLDVREDPYPPDNRRSLVRRIADPPASVLLLNGLPSPESGHLMQLLGSLGRYRSKSLSLRDPGVFAAVRNVAIIILIRSSDFMKPALSRILEQRIRQGALLLYIHGEGGQVPAHAASILPFQVRNRSRVQRGNFVWSQPEEHAGFVSLPAGLPGGDSFRYLFKPVFVLPRSTVFVHGGRHPALLGRRIGKGYSAALLGGPVWQWDRGGLAYKAVTYRSHRFFASLLRSLQLRKRMWKMKFTLSASRVLPGTRTRIQLYSDSRSAPPLRFRLFSSTNSIALGAMKRAQNGVLAGSFSYPFYATGLFEYSQQGRWQDTGLRLICGMAVQERENAGGENPVLRTIASVNQGRMLTLDNLTSLPEAGKARVVLQLQHLPLFNNAVIMAMLSILFLAAVYLRWQEKK